MDNTNSSFFNWFTNSRSTFRLLRITIWVITAASGFLQAWASRFWISADGNSYLDIASVYLRSDWSHAINAFWSPLYSWLLALSLGIFRPAPSWESTVLHLLNLVGLLLSLCAFEFFFRAFLRWQRSLQAPQETGEQLPELAWWALGYALFLSTSLQVLSVVNTTPDVWVAVFTYIIAGLTLRIASNNGGWPLFLTLGLTLGGAYLTKSFYFPMSFVFLLAAWLATRKPVKTIRQAALGFLAFALVAGPWLVMLSRAKGRFTFGDAGKLNFAIFHDRLPRFFFWQGENGTGIPVHPVRQILSKPHLYEFATPVGGTYPPSFDPSYWMEGVQVRFGLRSLLQVLRQSAGTFLQIWTTQSEFALAALFLFFLLPAKSAWFLVLRRQYYLWVPPLIACLSYSIVLVELRYVAPFVLLLWVAALGSLLAGNPGLPLRFTLALMLAILVVTCVRIAKSATSDVVAIGAGQENVNWQVAEGLRELGSQPGDKVAGLSRVAEAHWARLAGVKIVAEIPLGDENTFWLASPAEKQRVFQILAGTGAKFVVTKDPPVCAAEEGWVPISATDFYAYRLPSVLRPEPGSGPPH
jgi:4-amino-4-deoxy-L-arabinose transferase-like glycosyltransferase